MTTPQINIENAVRAALGDLTLQLIAARAEIEGLKAHIETLGAEPVKSKVNGKGKEPPDEAQSRHQ